MRMTNAILIYTKNVLAKPYDNPKLKVQKLYFLYTPIVLTLSASDIVNPLRQLPVTVNPNGR